MMKALTPSRYLSMPIYIDGLDGTLIHFFDIFIAALKTC
jgi:hypothetical protein